jgi:hypothetical protein
MIANEALENSSLTWRARGVLAYLLSRPEDWSTSAERLAAMSPKGKEGRDAMRAVLTELEAAGYIRREKSQDARGRWSTTLVVYDYPEPSVQADPPAKTSPEPTIVEPAKNGGSPGVGEPAVGQPAVGKPGVFNKTDTNTENKISSSSSSLRSDDSSSEEMTPMEKLARWPGREYLSLAAGRWSWLTVDKTWELTQKYLADIRTKGWKYSPDGWLKFLENEDRERERRTRGRAYAPNGVPL